MSVDEREEAGRGGSTIDLLHRYHAGDGNALEELLARNLAPLRRWATGRLPAKARDLRDTEDLVQETILQALPHIAEIEYRGEGAVQAYLRQAIMNRIRNEYRRAGRKPDQGEVHSRLADHGLSPLDVVVGKDVSEDYEAALASLGEDDRILVILRLELEFGYQAIAEATGRPSPDAARMATSRAIVRLAQAMRTDSI